MVGVDTCPKSSNFVNENCEVKLVKEIAPNTTQDVIALCKQAKTMEASTNRIATSMAVFG